MSIEKEEAVDPEELLKPTKTYRYLFQSFLKIFHTKEVREVFDPHISGIKIINVFLADKDVPKYKYKDGILHIVCRIDGVDSLKYLEKLKIGNSGHHYIDSYIIQSSPRIIVIQFRAMRGMAFKHFLDSNYKSMFNSSMLERPTIKDQFIKGKTKEGRLTYINSYRVFTDDPTLRKAMSKRLGVDETHLVQLASKLDFNKEIVNIKKYIKDVREFL